MTYTVYFPSTKWRRHHCEMFLAKRGITKFKLSRLNGRHVAAVTV